MKTWRRLARAQSRLVSDAVVAGVDEAGVRQMFLKEYNIEVGAGLGPLAGKIWRVGLMGHSSQPRLIVLLLAAFERALARQGRAVHA